MMELLQSYNEAMTVPSCECTVFYSILLSDNGAMASYNEVITEPSCDCIAFYAILLSDNGAIADR